MSVSSSVTDLLCKETALGADIIGAESKDFMNRSLEPLNSSLSPLENIYHVPIYENHMHIDVSVLMVLIVLERLKQTAQILPAWAYFILAKCFACQFWCDLHAWVGVQITAENYRDFKNYAFR